MRHRWPTVFWCGGTSSTPANSQSLQVARVPRAAEDLQQLVGHGTVRSEPYFGSRISTAARGALDLPPHVQLAAQEVDVADCRAAVSPSRSPAKAHNRDEGAEPPS